MLNGHSFAWGMQQSFLHHHQHPQTMLPAFTWLQCNAEAYKYNSCLYIIWTLAANLRPKPRTSDAICGAILDGICLFQLKVKQAHLWLWNVPVSWSQTFLFHYLTLTLSPKDESMEL